MMSREGGFFLYFNFSNQIFGVAEGGVAIFGLFSAILGS